MTRRTWIDSLLAILAVGPFARLLPKPRETASATLTYHEHDDHTVTLSREQAVEALTNIPRRISQRDDGYGYGIRVHVLYQHRWLELCRQDLYRQVFGSFSYCPGVVWRTDPVAYYQQRIQYGARITEDAFVVIDALTDPFSRPS